MISIIAAMAKNRVIGNKNEIPWYISDDLKRTRRITTEHPIIMGQNTHESISRYVNGGGWKKGKLVHRLLPERTNIILSKEKNYKVPGGIVAHSMDEAIEEAEKSPGSDEIFIIGGASVYAQAIDRAEKIYLTVVDFEPKGDVFFPEINESDWMIIERESHEKDKDNKYGYEYITYVNKFSCDC